jgi:hypothetical protein
MQPFVTVVVRALIPLIQKIACNLSASLSADVPWPSSWWCRLAMSRVTLWSLGIIIGLLETSGIQCWFLVREFHQFRGLRGSGIRNTSPTLMINCLHIGIGLKNKLKNFKLVLQNCTANYHCVWVWQ